MVVPGGSGGTGAEGSFEAAVQALYETIGLWVVGGGRVVGDVPDGGEVLGYKMIADVLG